MHLPVGVDRDANEPAAMKRVLLFSTLLAMALGLSGCDKCGDYFWINGATPHSCKDGPAPK